MIGRRARARAFSVARRFKIFSSRYGRSQINNALCTYFLPPVPRRIHFIRNNPARGVSPPRRLLMRDSSLYDGRISPSGRYYSAHVSPRNYSCRPTTRRAPWFRWNKWRKRKTRPAIDDLSRGRFRITRCDATTRYSGRDYRRASCFRRLSALSASTMMITRRDRVETPR